MYEINSYNFKHCDFVQLQGFRGRIPFGSNGILFGDPCLGKVTKLGIFGAEEAIIGDEVGVVILSLEIFVKMVFGSLIMLAVVTRLELATFVT